jgi:hypothetical protein
MCSRRSVDEERSVVAKTRGSSHESRGFRMGIKSRCCFCCCWSSVDGSPVLLDGDKKD